jgi:hypothetical protein
MNDLTIRNFEEIKDSLINIKKPIQNRGNYYFDIFYKNELLLFQTNITKLISKGYYNEFIMYDTAFKEKLQQLLGYIYKTIKKNNTYEEYFKGKKQISVFNENILKISNLEHEIDVYDIEYKLKGGKEALNLQDNVRLILYLKNVWINQSSFGVNLKVVQIQLLEPYNIKVCLFRRNFNPPPPPPPLPIRKQEIALQSNDLSNSKKYTNMVIRPTLQELLLSKTKLKKIYSN